MTEHKPVLYDEILFYLRPQPGGKYIDGTVGAGGHTAGLLAASEPDGKVLGLDRDAEAIAYCRERLANLDGRVTLVQANYSDMVEVARQHDFAQVDGVLLDLGLSSRQLSAAERGFSFQSEGPLDMRFDTTQGATAADLLNELEETELTLILQNYGEMPQSRKVARSIIEARPIHTTAQLVELAEKVIGRRRQRGARRIHPATRLFQALRIAVNDELGALERVLPDTVGLLRPGGRLAIISFHSLEDRIVKHFIREQSRECTCPPEAPICTCETQPMLRAVTRKVVRPSEAEVAANPRSRSARLRVAEKLEEVKS
ncbi:MAG: 16S rRNA (cytosine(1402)-N(4))-methyltransferase RsmH [Chloroflexota bacterium]|jgi:16S rRNA (cytosine1402-N4)-methyltransferase